MSETNGRSAYEDHVLGRPYVGPESTAGDCEKCGEPTLRRFDGSLLCANCFDDAHAYQPGEQQTWPPKVDTVSVDLGAEGRAIAAFLEILEELPAHSQSRVIAAVNGLMAPIVADESEQQANFRRLRETFGDGE